ncbi:hypothetical protein V3F56_05495 [Moorellaceae bacterium AZ2]
MALKGGCIVAQSGGPTPVINNSLYGVIEEAWNRQAITGLYGALYGVTGVLKEQWINLFLLYSAVMIPWIQSIK